MKNLLIVCFTVALVLVVCILLWRSSATSTDLSQWETVQQQCIAQAPTPEYVDSAIMQKDGSSRFIDKIAVLTAMKQLKPETLQPAGKDNRLTVTFKKKDRYGHKRFVNMTNVDWNQDDPFAQTMTECWKQGKEQ